MEGLPALLRKRAESLRARGERATNIVAKELDQAAELLERLLELARFGRVMRKAQRAYFAGKTAALLRESIGLEKTYDQQAEEILGEE